MSRYEKTHWIVIFALCKGANVNVPPANHSTRSYSYDWQRPPPPLLPPPSPSPSPSPLISRPHILTAAPSSPDLPFTLSRSQASRHRSFVPSMAPLLLLFLLGGLCALFSLSSAASSRANKKCGDGGEAKIRGEKQEEEEEERKGRPGPDPEADLGIVFSTFDHDGDGFITAVELEESLKRLGIAVSNAEAAAMVSRVDANNDGLIDIHEFRELYDSIPKRRKHLPSTTAAAAEEDDDEEEEDDERDLRDAFDVFDGNKDGLISAEELGTVLGSLGLRRHGGRPAVAECRDMIRLVDSDGDGMVSFEEFKRMMTVVKV
ncbi:hypothetical protein GUJ93_ZPchr0012g20331 [Zizania palustris]|uniref:EF-hand domain-containing protein n=1 Tax=Zizania palustris TaxID=103762 RepID=A0A8J5WRT9_ZIZPA|nr:hypothetical protein GUJ93_ZPchr0012g20331 [Zizania palustris]